MTARRRWMATIELESMESGELKIPPLEVLYRLPDSFAATVRRTRRIADRASRCRFKSSVCSRRARSRTQFRDIKDTAELAASRSPSHESNLAHHRRCSAGLCGWPAWCCGHDVADGRRQRVGHWRKSIRSNRNTSKNTVDVANAYSRLSTVLREYLEAEMAFPATSLFKRRTGQRIV